MMCLVLFWLHTDFAGTRIVKFLGEDLTDSSVCEHVLIGDKKHSLSNSCHCKICKADSCYGGCVCGGGSGGGG